MTVNVRSIMVNDSMWGAVYTFEKVGDVFPIHTHTEHDNHITVLMHGKIKLLGKYEGTIIEAIPGGTIIKWIPGEPHGFESITDGATIFNILEK